MRIEQGKRQDGWMLMDAPKTATEPSEHTSIRGSLTKDTLPKSPESGFVLCLLTLSTPIFKPHSNLQHLVPNYMVLIKEEILMMLYKPSNQDHPESLSQLNFTWISGLYGSRRPMQGWNGVDEDSFRYAGGY
jgi:hypothetical protein